jgi:hypothetical protein
MCSKRRRPLLREIWFREIGSGAPGTDLRTLEACAGTQLAGPTVVEHPHSALRLRPGCNFAGGVSSARVTWRVSAVPVAIALLVLAVRLVAVVIVRPRALVTS